MDPRRENGATAPDSAPDTHKALVRWLVEEAVNQGHLDVVADVCTPATVAAQTADDEPALIRELLALYRGAVPDARWTVEQQVADDDTLVTRFTAYGTQHGALLGLPPTHRPMAVPGVLITRYRSGTLVLQWALADLLGLLQQLGVLPHLTLDRAVAVARLLRAGAVASGASSPTAPSPDQGRAPPTTP